MTAPLLATETLSRAFGALSALSRVSLEVAPRERRAIIGPNGAGKTTLFNVITGQLAPTSGRILLDEPTAGMSPEETLRMTRMLEALPRDVTLLIIEHDMDVVGSLADRVTVLHYGEVLTEGTFAQVKADPRVYEVYLGSA